MRSPERPPSRAPTVEDALALGLTRAEYELVCEKQGRPPNRGRARDVLAAVERALRLQALQEAAAHAADRGAARGHGPGRERRRGRRRRRARVRVQGRVAQPPERGRAVPGRGHRRRRHPARHLRDRRAPDRGARLAALRRAARARSTRYLLDGAVVGDRPLRQLDRRADGRRRGLLRGRPTSRTASSTRWRSGSRRASGSCAARPPARATCSCCSAPRTGRDGIGGASVLASAELGAERRPARTSARPSRSATRSRRRSCWSARSSCSSAACSSSLQDLGAAGLTSSAAEMASKGGVGIDIDVAKVPLREPGMEPFEVMVSESQERMLCVVEPANARRRDRAVREVGGERRGDRHGHRHAADARARRGRARRRHAGRGARRRLPAV